MPETQLSLPLVQHELGQEVIYQRVRDGYVNATAMCKAAGKAWADYRRLGSTQASLDELQADVGTPMSELVQSIKGGEPSLKGTWVHPQVAIHLAQWLQADQVRGRTIRSAWAPYPFLAQGATIEHRALCDPKSNPSVRQVPPGRLRSSRLSGLPLRERQGRCPRERCET